MMVGENASPSATAGRIRCWQALQNTSRRPTSKESSNKKPVMCGSGSPGDTCPVNGSHCSSTPNTNSRISPQRNSGIDNSTIEARSATGSNGVPRRRNSSKPPPRPRIAAIAMAQAASWMVAGKVAATSSPASRRSAMERPKSPCNAPASQIKYCCGRGLSRPISRRLSSISAIVAFGGSDIAAGSTGNSRRMQNNSAETISRIGIAASKRRAISLRTVAVILLRLVYTKRSAAKRQLHRNVCGSTQPLAYLV